MTTPERQEYLERLSISNIDIHRETQAYGIEELNKIIFVVSTGTFVLSISFIGYLKTEVTHPWLLIFSWIFLILAITCNVAAHLITVFVADRRMTHLNTSRKRNYDPHWETLTADDKSMHWWIKQAKRINIAVWLFLSGGLFFLLWFGGSNLLVQNALYHEQNIQNKNIVASSTCSYQEGSSVTQ